MWESIRQFYHELPEWWKIFSWILFSLAIIFAMTAEKLKTFFKKSEVKETTTITNTETITESQVVKDSENTNVLVIKGHVSNTQISINSPKQEEKKSEDQPVKTFFVKDFGVFGIINKIRNYEFNKMTFEHDEDNRKKNLFIKFMSIPIDSLEKHLFRLEEIQDMDSLSKDEFNTIVMGIMYDHINETKDLMIKEFGYGVLSIISDSEFNKNINDIMLEEMEGYLKERNSNESNICALSQCISAMYFKLKLIFTKNYEKYTHLNGILDEIIKEQDEEKK